MASWLVRPLAAAGLITVGGSATVPVTIGSNTTQISSGPTPSPTPTPASTPGAPRPVKIGVNLAKPWWWNGQRSFSNLLMADVWHFKGPTDTKSRDIPADQVDAYGNVIKLNPGEEAQLNFAVPPLVQQGKSVDIICRWAGKGQVYISLGTVFKNMTYTANTARFTWQGGSGRAGFGSFRVRAVDVADPIRNIDCRETTADPKAVFDPAFVASLRKYNTIRFMYWQRTTENFEISWAKRTTAASQVFGVDGTSIEHMIMLANETKTNPWFCMPWNADADYIRKFAEMVRDKLDPTLVAYVEVSNEVWNGAMAASYQAQQEAVAKGLKNGNIRFAEKHAEVMGVWNSVFAGKMPRIVRVISNQNVNPSRTLETLVYNDNWKNVDAIATAPYFPYNLDNETYNPADVSSVFPALKKKIDERLVYMADLRKLAEKYKIRYVTYEAGQHVLGKDLASNLKIQRDPRMGQIYSYYLDKWRETAGDLMMLFEDIDGAPGSWGAFGMQEYPGQPLSQAPKANATHLFIASINNK